jgi:hypothetical protein
MGFNPWYFASKDFSSFLMGYNVCNGDIDGGEKGCSLM